MKKLLMLAVTWLYVLCSMGQERASADYTTDFEQFENYFDGGFNESLYWTCDYPDGNGKAYVSPFYGSRSGSSALNLTGSIPGILGDYWIAEVKDAVLRLNLNANKVYELTFYSMETYEEASGYGCVTDPSFQSKSFDGVYLSDDEGATYAKVHNFDDQSNSQFWDKVTLNISALAQLNGMELNDKFRIKFQYNTIVASKNSESCFYNKRVVIDDLSLTDVSSNYISKTRVSFTYDENGSRTDKQITVEQILNVNGLKSGSADEGIDTPQVTYEVYVSPNPTKGLLNVSIKGGDSQDKLTYKLVDLSGNLLRSGTISNFGVYSLNISDCKDGIYLLNIEGKRSKQVYKVIKH